MSWSKQGLQKLSEPALTTSVVIPLFENLGYRDVRLHHGSQELGKDVVMWKPDDFGTRRNWALVIKAVPLSGKASAIGAVGAQIRQALGSTFRDDRTGVEHSVNHVILVASHECSQPALTSLSAAFANELRTSQVSFLFGARLWELVSKHLPKVRLFGPIAALQESLAEIHHVVHVTATSAYFSPDPDVSKETDPVVIRTDFPEGDTGSAMAEEISRFLMFGGKVAVPKEYLSFSGKPHPLDFLLENAAPGSLVELRADPPEARLIGALRISRPDGPPVELIPYVDFLVHQIGPDRIRLNNEAQGLPLVVSIELDLPSSSGTMSCKSLRAPENAVSFYSALRVQAEMAQGGSVSLERLTTGIETRLFELEVQPRLHPGKSFVDLWRRISEVQRRTRVVIPAPDQGELSADDIRALVRIEAVLRSGVLEDEIGTFSVTLSPAVTKQIPEIPPSGLLGRVEFGFPTNTEKLVGTAVDLGPIQVLFECAQIPLDRLGVVQKSWARACAGDQAEIQVPLEPAEGTNVQARFPRWIPTGDNVTADG